MVPSGRNVTRRTNAYVDEALKAGRVASLRAGRRSDRRLLDLIALAEQMHVPIRRVADQSSIASRAGRLIKAWSPTHRRGRSTTSTTSCALRRLRRCSSCSTESKTLTTSARSCEPSTRPVRTAG